MEKIVLYQDGLLLFFNSFFIDADKAMLIPLVLGAALIDIRRHRIPNWLVASGTCFSLLYSGLSPYGIGLTASAGGWAVGLGLLLPLYAMRAMGAGDVKLMAMVGAFLGPMSAVSAVVTTLIAGGVLAIGTALYYGTARHTLQNVRFVLTNTLLAVSTGSRVQSEGAYVSAGKLPYGVAIAAGTILHLCLARYSHAILG